MRGALPLEFDGLENGLENGVRGGEDLEADRAAFGVVGRDGGLDGTAVVDEALEFGGVKNCPAVGGVQQSARFAGFETRRRGWDGEGHSVRADRDSGGVVGGGNGDLRSDEEARGALLERRGGAGLEAAPDERVFEFVVGARGGGGSRGGLRGGARDFGFRNDGGDCADMGIGVFEVEGRGFGGVGAGGVDLERLD